MNPHGYSQGEDVKKCILKRKKSIQQTVLERYTSMYRWTILDLSLSPLTGISLKSTKDLSIRKLLDERKMFENLQDRRTDIDFLKRFPTAQKIILKRYKWVYTKLENLRGTKETLQRKNF